MGKITFKTRLRAWWEGVDAADLVGDDGGILSDFDGGGICLLYTSDAADD